MSVPWAKELMAFATSKLPDLLSELGEERARAEAFERLAELWRETQKLRRKGVPIEAGANLPNPVDAVAAGRAETDRKLRSRRGRARSSEPGSGPGEE